VAKYVSRQSFIEKDNPSVSGVDRYLAKQALNSQDDIFVRSTGVEKYLRKQS